MLTFLDNICTVFVIRVYLKSMASSHQRQSCLFIVSTMWFHDFLTSPKHLWITIFGIHTHISTWTLCPIAISVEQKAETLLDATNWSPQQGQWLKQKFTLHCFTRLLQRLHQSMTLHIHVLDAQIVSISNRLVKLENVLSQMMRDKT